MKKIIYFVLFACMMSSCAGSHPLTNGREATRRVFFNMIYRAETKIPKASLLFAREVDKQRRKTIARHDVDMFMSADTIFVINNYDELDKNNIWECISVGSTSRCYRYGIKGNASEWINDGQKALDVFRAQKQEYFPVEYPFRFFSVKEFWVNMFIRDGNRYIDCGKKKLTRWYDDFDDHNWERWIVQVDSIEWPVTICAPDTNIPEPEDSSLPTIEQQGGALNFIDLGLPSGTLWADRNLGANNPFESGDYYAWGELFPKEMYTWRNYLFLDVANYHTNSIFNCFTKYISDKSDPNFDGLKQLECIDDVVIHNLGPTCHIPTSEQFRELLDNCQWKWSRDASGGKGYLVTGKNGNSVFFPACGCYSDTLCRVADNRRTFGAYWSSDVRGGTCIGYAYAFVFQSYWYENNLKEQWLGLPVRPVK